MELAVLFLVVAVAVLTALARVLGVPYPILLVILHALERELDLEDQRLEI